MVYVFYIDKGEKKTKYRFFTAYFKKQYDYNDLLVIVAFVQR